MWRSVNSLGERNERATFDRVRAAPSPCAIQTPCAKAKLFLRVLHRLRLSCIDPAHRVITDLQQDIQPVNRTTCLVPSDGLASRAMAGLEDGMQLANRLSEFGTVPPLEIVMHQESMAYEGNAAGLPAFALMSVQPQDQRRTERTRAERSDDKPRADGDSTPPEPPARVITPAVERVLDWHRQRSM